MYCFIRNFIRSTNKLCTYMTIYFSKYFQNCIKTIIITTLWLTKRLFMSQFLYIRPYLIYIAVRTGRVFDFFCLLLYTYPSGYFVIPLQAFFCVKGSVSHQFVHWNRNRSNYRRIHITCIKISWATYEYNIFHERKTSDMYGWGILKHFRILNRDS